MNTLIIAEKPSVASKIALAIGGNKTEKKTYNRKVPYYIVDNGPDKIFVVSAVGHLFNLREKNKKGWTYPVFDVEWKPVYEINKSAKYTKDYIFAIKKLAKDSKKFIVATDFDDEGSVIGYNVIRYVCDVSDAERMKFSTTTKEDLIKAYEKRMKSMDMENVDAGVTRHKLDFFWGINLSRALTLSIKDSTGMFKLMSIGRVQGPTLKILSEREREIQNFKPVPFWVIEIVIHGLVAHHETEKFWDKDKALAVFNDIEKKDAIVDEIKSQKFEQQPPHPFDLTNLQLEAYKLFKISPKDTLAIAQDLYTNSYISYPRTSSNQLPSTVPYKDIIKKLQKIPDYAELCSMLLKNKNLKPNNGKKKDPAHPAIYPTGEIPQSLSGKESKIYDLIVRRTLASFGKSAWRETDTLILKVEDEKFLTKATRTVEEGWHAFYGSLIKLEEKNLPKFEEGQTLKVDDFIFKEDETKPPKRYTPASIIKALEKLNLGTKATRSKIIENLYERNYISENSMQVTELGMRTVETLEKYSKDILDVNMTKMFELNLEKIRNRKIEPEKVIDVAKTTLIKILDKFKKHEKEIGKALAEAFIDTRNKESIVGECPNCKKGHLRIMYSRKYKSYFVSCSNYPECKTIFGLTWGLPKPTGKKCSHCGYPLVMIIRKGKRPFEYCINKNCPQKVEWRKNHPRPEEKSKD